MTMENGDWRMDNDEKIMEENNYAYNAADITNTNTTDTSTFSSQASNSFERDGFVVIRNLFPPELIRELYDVAISNFHECFDILYTHGHTQVKEAVTYNDAEISSGTCCNVSGPNPSYALKIGIKNGFREIVMRSPGRFEMPYGCSSRYAHTNSGSISSTSASSYENNETNDSFLRPEKESIFQNPAITQNELLLDIVSKSLGIDKDDNATDEASYRIINTSIVLSTPMSQDQKFHADGGHVNVLEHLPCHCLNVFIPLVDISTSSENSGSDYLGGTEIKPGTHYHTRNLVPLMLAAKARKTLRPTITPELRIGDALLFDYRVLHRGKANTSKGDKSKYRPILVLTFAKSWFRDIANFPHKSIFDKNES